MQGGQAFRSGNRTTVLVLVALIATAGSTEARSRPRCSSAAMILAIDHQFFTSFMMPTAKGCCPTRSHVHDRERKGAQPVLHMHQRPRADRKLIVPSSRKGPRESTRTEHMSGYLELARIMTLTSASASCHRHIVIACACNMYTVTLNVWVSRSLQHYLAPSTVHVQSQYSIARTPHVLRDACTTIQVSHKRRPASIYAHASALYFIQNLFAHDHSRDIDAGYLNSELNTSLYRAPTHKLRAAIAIYRETGLERD